MNYAVEKLLIAVDCLATSPSPIQKRLEMAMQASLTLKEADFPEDLRSEWSSIRHELTSELAAADEGTIAATTGKLSDEDAVMFAQRIYGLYTKLADPFGLNKA